MFPNVLQEGCFRTGLLTEDLRKLLEPHLSPTDVQEVFSLVL